MMVEYLSCVSTASMGHGWNQYGNLVTWDRAEYEIIDDICTVIRARCQGPVTLQVTRDLVPP